MNVQEKIEKWCKDENFLMYADKRMREEICSKPKNQVLDSRFEELNERFDIDDRYISPMVSYLTYRLQLAKLNRNRKKRRRGVWWVFVQVTMLGPYVKVFESELSNLLTELQEEIMPMLHYEYIQNLKGEKNKIW